MGDWARLRLQHYDYNSVEFTDMGERGIMIEIDAPWAGSTESGFGQTISMTISRTQACELAQWIADHA